MKLLGLPLGPMQTNCYILHNEESKATIVIDPGAEAERLIGDFKAMGADLKAVLLTHAHGDHIGAVEKLRLEFSAPLYMHSGDVSMLIDSNKNFSAMMGAGIACKNPEHLVEDGEVLSFDEEISLKVLHTPGHTAGGVCYYSEELGLLFSGDTLFAESIGRTDFPGGSYATLIENIKSKLMVLPEKTRVFSGHGPETSIGWEKEHNPFIR